MNRERDNDYSIPINGLSAGKHTFDFAIGKSFFDEFENSKILDGKLVAIVELDKSVSLINVACSIKGSLLVECDRCLGELSYPLDITPRLIVKFVRTQDEPDNEEVMIMDAGESELDLRQFFYDYIYLSLPISCVHPEDECDPEVVAKLLNIKGISEENKKSVSAFEKLKDLLNNNS
jgi:uncharacterized protein